MTDALKGLREAARAACEAHRALQAAVDERTCEVLDELIQLGEALGLYDEEQP